MVECKFHLFHAITDFSCCIHVHGNACYESCDSHIKVWNRKLQAIKLIDDWSIHNENAKAGLEHKNSNSLWHHIKHVFLLMELEFQHVLTLFLYILVYFLFIHTVVTSYSILYLLRYRLFFISNFGPIVYVIRTHSCYKKERIEVFVDK